MQYWSSPSGTVVESDNWKDALQQVRRIEGYHGQMIEDLESVTADDYIAYLKAEIYTKNREISKLKQDKEYLNSKLPPTEWPF